MARQFVLVLGMMLAGLAGTEEAAWAQAAKVEVVSTGTTYLGAITDAPVDRLNANTISIVSGGAGSANLRMVADMAAELDSDALRILPIAGRGGGQNIIDLAKLRGVDLAIAQTDILKLFRTKVAGGPALLSHLAYVAKLNDEELHVVARGSIASLAALAGKTVSFGEAGSSEDVSGRRVFEMLGITVKAVNVAQGEGLELLKAGQADAAIVIVGKPSRALQTLPDAAGLHLLSIPLAEALEEDYLPAQLSHADYPSLIRVGETVETIAVSTALVTYAWGKDSDRYRRIARFVEAFFGRFGQLQKTSHHPKWNDINLAATIPGWTRFQAAQEWLDQTNGRPKLAGLAAAKPKP